MTQLSAEILAQCFDAIDRGDATLEECLARHPQHSEELMPILAMAVMLRDDPSAGPRPLFRRTARQRLLSKLTPRTPDRRGLLGRPFWQTLPRRAAAWIAAVIVFIVILGSSGIVYAGTRTLPGDALYPVKTTVEEARLWIARGEDDVQLCLQFAEYRIQEIRRLGTIGRFSDVSTAANRFGTQMRGADEALLELAEYEPELAATLALRAEQTRTQYRQELSGLLQAVPDSERAAIEDMLALDDDLRPHDLEGDDDRQESTPATNDGRPASEDDLHPDGDDSPLAVEPKDRDDDRAGEDRPDGPADTPERPDHDEDTGSGLDRDEDEERTGDPDPAPDKPEQEHPGTDDDTDSTPGSGDQREDTDESESDEDERGTSDDEASSDDEDGSRDEDEPGDDDSEECDGSGSGGESDRSEHAGREHDGEGERND